MDQSKSNKTEETLGLPKRTFSLEFFVGLFTMAGVLAIAYLAVGLGGIEIFSGNKYDVVAEFDNISGLGMGASVEIAGVPVGTVSNISLGKRADAALVTLHLNGDVRIRDDDILSIRTKGIIGDRYIKISPGASDTYIPAGGRISEKTESVVDIEDIIGKLVHSLSSDKEESSDKKKGKE